MIEAIHAAKFSKYAKQWSAERQKRVKAETQLGELKKFDRLRYQREYMRKWRAKKNAERVEEEAR